LAPVVPAAPPRLSMMSDWPRIFAIGSCSARAMMSVEPPAGYGTMSRIGRDG